MVSKKHEDGYLWDEALPEILDDILPGANLLDGLTSGQWDELSEALNQHVSNARDFMAPTPSSRDLEEMHDRPVIAGLKQQVADLERRLDIYHDDIKRRHGGQSNHADLSTGHVVIYDQ